MNNWDWIHNWFEICTMDRGFVNHSSEKNPYKKIVGEFLWTIRYSFKNSTKSLIHKEARETLKDGFIDIIEMAQHYIEVIEKMDDE